MSRLVAAVADAEATLHRSRLVAVDGPAGSGKTTLADDLGRAMRTAEPTLQVAILHMDDLYDGWTGLNTALEERVLDQILRPLHTGRPAHWHQYDWHTGRFASWHELPEPDVLILEGCGSGAVRYAPYTSLLVWVEAARDTRIARGLTRDGEQVREHWLRWMELESGYFALNRTAQRADISCLTD